MMYINVLWCVLLLQTNLCAETKLFFVFFNYEKDSEYRFYMGIL